MAFGDNTKRNVPFKRVLFKGHTSNDKEFFNEAQTSNIQVPIDSIFADTIPTASGAAVASGIAELLEFRLELDNTSNGKAYLAYFPDSHSSSGQRASNIIPQGFAGDDFRAILYDNGTEIPPLDNRNWFWDTSAAIVTSETDLDLGSTGTIRAFAYTGTLLSELVSQSGIRGLPGVSGQQGPQGPQGESGASLSGSLVREDLSSQIGPSRNKTFTMSYSAISGTLKVEWNGLVQKPQSISTSGLTFTTVFAAYENNSIIAEYLSAGS